MAITPSIDTDASPLSSSHYEVPRPGLYRATNRILNKIQDRRGGIHYHGLENLPPPGEPFIAAPVHRSVWDPPAIARMFLEERNASFYALAKDGLWGKKFLLGTFGAYLALCGGIKLDQKKFLTSQPLVMEKVSEVLDNNGILTIFPEGRCKLEEWETVERKDLNNGVGLIALKYGIKLVPIGLAGTARASRWPMHVAVEEPIDVPHIPDIFGDRRTLVKAAKSNVPPLMDELHEKLQKAQQRAIDERLGLA